MNLTLTGGPEPITLAVNPNQATLVLPGKNISEVGEIDPGEALRNPVDYPLIEQCLTPEDRVVVALEGDGLGDGPGVSALLKRLGAHWTGEMQVTLLLGAHSPVESEGLLRDRFPGTKVVRHDPGDPGNSCYLATLRQGKRVYLNREFLESDFQVFVGSPRKGLEGKLAGPESAILAGLDVPAKEGEILSSSELREIIGYMGNSYFLVHVDSSEAANWWAGDQAAVRRAKMAHREVWKGEVRGAANLVVVGTGLENANDFPFWCRAIKKARGLVSDQGDIVLVPGANPDLSPWQKALERAGEPGDILENIRRYPKNMRCVRWWAYAAEKARLHLPSYLPDKTFDLLFASPVPPEGIQSLVEKSSSVAVIGDYSKAVVKSPA